MDAQTILKRREKAAAERARYEPMWDDAMRLTMPGRKRFYQSNRIEAGEDIFDETGANAVEEFVSRMQAGIMPPFEHFLKMRASSLVAEKDRKAINKDLDDISKYVFEEIWRSNFAQESAESLNDLALSTGTLLVEDGFGEERLHHKAIPLTDIELEVGYDGRIGGQFRCVEIEAKQLEGRYRRMKTDEAPQTKAAIDREQDKKLKIVEFTERSFSEKGEKCLHMVIVQDFKEVIVHEIYEGAGSSPFISYRWSSAAGETWGRGPLTRALGAVRTTNLMVELVLENAAMSIVGIYQTDNDATINADTVQLIPGAILSREPGTRGLEPVQGNPGNFNMRDVVLSDQRTNIKRALYNDMLADPNKTPATATEVVERMADLAYRTSSGFLRVHHEFLVPYMRRAIYLLEKRGDIEMPTHRGRAISYVPVSPLAQAQLARKLQSLFQDFQMRAAMFGPEQAQGHYDFERLHPWMVENFGLDENLYYSAKDIVENLRKAAERMAEAQMMQQGQSIGPAEGAQGAAIQPSI